MSDGRRAATEPDQTEVVASDLEGTLSSAETWWALARRLRASGLERRYRLFVLRRLPAIVGVRLGLVERQRFRDRWLADLASLLRGTSVARFEQLAAAIVAEDLWPARNRAAVEELVAHIGARRSVVLCSGTYQPVLEAFARRLGAAEALGTPLEASDGTLTGRLAELPNTGPRKAARLKTALAGRNLRAAYGDSLADAEMLESAAEPVAVLPEPDLRSLAGARGWRVLEAG